MYKIEGGLSGKTERSIFLDFGVSQPAAHSGSPIVFRYVPQKFAKAIKGVVSDLLRVDPDPLACPP
jgi:hypothetical protein